jgi:hypothetical protein
LNQIARAILVAGFGTLWAGLAAADTGPVRPTYIKAGRLFDGTGEGYRRDAVIIVAGDRISAIEGRNRRPRSPRQSRPPVLDSPKYGRAC